jgi:hypothetical protein
MRSPLAPHFLARELLPANGCADADGRFWFRSVKMVGYPIPTDGVVGRLLAAQDHYHTGRPTCTGTSRTHEAACSGTGRTFGWQLLPALEHG